jgi:4-amino-4-deoxy-L-arabinose transferase-like glycosyltransferase
MSIAEPTSLAIDPPAQMKTCCSREAIFWHVLLSFVLVIVVFCAVRWSLRHPGATNWDEAHYFNYIYRDHASLFQNGIKRLLAGLVYEDTDRPPGYRLLALPITTVAGTSIAALRVFSIAGLLASLALLYGGVRRLTKSSSAAAMSAIMVAISPQVIEATAHYGTEVPLYLSIAGTLYFVLREWDNSRPSTLSWIGLGLSLAAGALAKVTFALFGGPILLLGILLCVTRRVRGPGVAFFFKAAILGGVISLPWWAKNVRHALRFATYSANEYERFNSPLWDYIGNVFVFGCGVMVAIAAAMCLAGLLAALLRHSNRLDAATRWALVLLLTPAGLLVISQAMSVNHSPRLMTPAFFCLAAVAAIGFAHARALRRPPAIAVFAVLFIVQACLFVLPPSWGAAVPPTRWTKMFLRDSDIWDYEPIFAYCQSLGLRNPSVGMLGNGYAFNIAQARLGWAKHGQDIRKREMLWRYENRDFDMNAIAEKARKFDVILTAPGFRGDSGQHQELDNQHNDAFARVLQADPTFAPPKSFRMGREHPADVLVFVKRQSTKTPVK